MKIVMASHTFAGGAFRVGSHYIANGLAELGHDVAHISTPVSRAHLLLGRVAPEKIEAARASAARDAAGVLHAVPLVWLPSQIASHRSFYRRLLGQIGFSDPDVLLIDQPLMAGILAAAPTTLAMEYHRRFPYDKGAAEEAKRLLIGAEFRVTKIEPNYWGHGLIWGVHD